MEGEEVTVTRFEPTETMSTYLLAIIVSEYTNISTNQGDTLVKPPQLSRQNPNPNTDQGRLHPLPLDPNLGSQDGH